MRTIAAISTVLLLLSVLSCGNHGADSMLNAPQHLIAIPNGLTEVSDVSFYWIATAKDVSHELFRRIGDSGPFSKVTDVRSSGSASETDFPNIVCSPTGPGPGGSGTTSYEEVTIAIDPASTTRHWYFVRYRTEDDQYSPPSRIVSFVPAELSQLAAITITYPLDGTTGISRSPDFTWDFVDTTMTYVVFLHSGGSDLWMHSTSISGCSLDDDSGIDYLPYDSDQLDPLTSYSWQVWAMSSEHCGMGVGTATFMTTE